MFNPEPASVTVGRRFLYDAARTSSRGDSYCASCHVFGDTDHLAWDLGNPDGDVQPAPGPFRLIFDPNTMDLHPMKGPMGTQSLRGMANHGPMHWRGDRSGGFNEPSAQPDSGSFDEEEAFRQFNEAFVGLLGRSSEIAPADMQAFTDFALQITYPPNPIRIAPIVGQQATLRLDNAAVSGPRVNLLIARAERGECDLVVHGRVFGEMRGYLYRNGHFVSDRANRPPLSALALRLLALLPGQELTFTCVPPGSSIRVGIDRDLDGVLNGDE